MKASAGKHILMLLENNTYARDDRVRREARSLVQAGYRVTVICPRTQDDPWRTVGADGVRVVSFPKPPAGDGLVGYVQEYGHALGWSLLLSLFVLFYDDFDAVHTHNPPDMYVLIAGLYKLLGKRFVYDHHDLSPEMYYARFQGQGNPLVATALKGFEWLSCRLADRVIATNHSYKRVEMERDGVPEDRITVVRNGPDLNRVKLAPPNAALRQKAGTIIGFVGEMGYQDGVDYLLRALKHLKDDLGRTDFYCVMIGRGDAWDDLQVQARALGLENHMWFTGRISDADLMSYLSTADICVGPDPKNDFTDRSTMIKMMEFMTLGKPIVAFDLTEHRFTAQEAAVYAEPNNELDYARKLAELMDDPPRRAEMGAYGQQRVHHQLAWPHQEQHLLAAYAALFAAD